MAIILMVLLPLLTLLVKVMVCFAITRSLYLRLRRRGLRVQSLALLSSSLPVIWVVPWLLFIATLTSGYDGKCLQGRRPCDFGEYVWAIQRWYLPMQAFDLACLGLALVFMWAVYLIDDRPDAVSRPRER